MLYKTKMQIEKAGIDEIWIIQSLADRVWAATYKHIITEQQIAYMMDMMYSTASLRRQMTEDHHCFLLVKDDDEYVGFVSYELNYKDRQTKIHKIYILPRMQGKHVGSLLIAEVERVASVNNNDVLTLNVNRDNKAVDFYEARGFEKTTTENIDIGNGFLMEDYVMTKKL